MLAPEYQGRSGLPDLKARLWENEIKADALQERMNEIETRVDIESLPLAPEI